MFIIRLLRCHASLLMKKTCTLYDTNRSIISLHLTQCNFSVGTQVVCFNDVGGGPNTTVKRRGMTHVVVTFVRGSQRSSGHIADDKVSKYGPHDNPRNSYTFVGRQVYIHKYIHNTLCFRRITSSRQ